MSKTEVSGKQIKDGTIEQVDLSATLSGDINTLKSDVSTLQSDVAGKASSASLATVATSGDYDDLSNKPSLFSGDYTDLSNKPSIPSSVDDLSDVTITTPSSGQVLKYNGSAWVNDTDSSFSGSYNDLTNKPSLFSGSYDDLTNKPSIPSAIDDLSDVTITSPSNTQVLQYNGSAWVNAAAPAGGASDLDGLSDVVITSAAKGHFLAHDGTSFVNSRTIEANAAATVPLTIKGAASQTANLLEVQNSSGTVRCYIAGDEDQAGETGVDATFFVAGGNNNRPTAIFRRTANPNYGFINFQDSAGTTQAGINTSYLFFSGSAFFGKAGTTGVQLLANGGAGGLFADNIGRSWSIGYGAAQQDVAALAINTLSSFASHKGLTVQQKSASPSANIFELQNSAGTAFTQIAGNGAAFFSVTSASAIPLIARAAASQTAALFQLQNSAGTVLSYFSPNGGFTIGSNSPIGGSSFCAIQATADDQKSLVLKARAAQWNSMIECTDSSNNVRFGVGPAGNTTISNSYNGATALAVGHSTNQTGDLIYASNNAVQKFKVDKDGAVTAANGSFTSPAAATKAFVVKGAASQSGSLFEIQNSSGTALNIIDSSGRVDVGNNARTIRSITSVATAVSHYAFNNSNGDVGFINTDGSSTTYQTSSDYRLKENVVPISDALSRVDELNPCRFNFKTDPSKTVDGFIAHELQDVIPEAVSGVKDQVNEDGSIKTQAVDYSRLTPLLAAAIKELKQKNDELEARLAALENK